jgi:hypothetical protein
METTFDKFINSDPKEKELFDKEYNEFLLWEFVLEKMEADHISVRTLAKKAGISDHNTKNTEQKRHKNKFQDIFQRIKLIGV